MYQRAQPPPKKLFPIWAILLIIAVFIVGTLALSSYQEQQRALREQSALATQQVILATQTAVLVTQDTQLTALPWTPTKTVPTGLYGNPWGYDHNPPGDLIDDPPLAFCEFFPCIKSFWEGSGYIVQCGDGTYSKSGGIRGACSQHGGEKRPLYAHPKKN